VRSIRHTKSPVAYLFILGDLTDGFRSELERRRHSLELELEMPVSFELVEQDRIAELYSALIARNETANTSALTL
jgi:hypothetical protein